VCVQQLNNGALHKTGSKTYECSTAGHTSGVINDSHRATKLLILCIRIKYMKSEKNRQKLIRLT